MTNKTLTSAILTNPNLNTPSGGNLVNCTGIPNAASADALSSVTTTVNVSSSTAPTVGQTLTATSGTAATWQTPVEYVGGTGIDVTGPTVSIDSTIVTLTGSQVMTNKTLTSAILTNPNLNTPSGGNLVNCTGIPNAASADALSSATTTVNVSSSTAPTVGQTLTATSGTAATWQSPPTYTQNSVLGADSSGAVQAITGFSTFNNTFPSNDAGLYVNRTAVSDNSGGSNMSGYNLDVEVTANAPNDQWNVLNIDARTDTTNSGNELGTNGNAVTNISNNFQQVGPGNLGRIELMRSNISLGNGVDATTVNGFGYSFGFGTVNTNVTLDGPIQGYGFQPNVDTGVFTTANTYVNAFYDSANIQVPVKGYNAFSSTPTLNSIANDSGYIGVQVTPTITDFVGNAGFTGVNMAPNITNMDTGGFNGITITPDVTDMGTSFMNGIYVRPTLLELANGANGLTIDMSACSGTGNVKAIDAKGDVNIDGSLSFTGDLSIGKLSAFFATAPITNIGGNPSTLQGLVTQVTAATSAVVAGSDTIGVNTAMLITLEDNSTTTSGPFGIGMSALALPCVVTTKTGSTLDHMNAGVFAINLDGVSSTGGTIDNVNMVRAVPIPSGGLVTIVNNSRGFYYHEPFGKISDNSWGLYNDAENENYVKGSLKIGGSDKVANSSIAFEVESTTKAVVDPRMTTGQRDALTAVAGMRIFNTTTSKFQGYDGSSWADFH
jgi:hypothetical protein